MKTIDEVIKAVHHCGLLTGFDDTYEYDGVCPYEDCFECEKKRRLGKDIIQYLTAYKDDKNELTAFRAYWAEQQANPPLTWEELRGMEGKPVWIELLNHGIWEDPSHRVDSEWWVIGEVRKDDIILATYLDEMELCEEDIGVLWKAYRKERK